MYSESNDNNRPIIPARADIPPNSQEESLLPQVPRRMDKQVQDNSTISRQVIKEITDEQYLASSFFSDYTICMLPLIDSNQIF
jgi:hypothetical protein